MQQMSMVRWGVSCTFFCYLVTPDNRLDGQVIVDHLVADGSGAADAAQGGQERRGRHFVPTEGGQRRRGLVARSSGCRIPKEGIPRGVHTRRVGEPRVVHILNILAGASIEERLGSNRYIVVSHSSTADGGRCVLGQEPSGKGAVASGDATDYRSGPIHSLEHKPNLTNGPLKTGATLRARLLSHSSRLFVVGKSVVV
jgi:hypothetical protein